MNVIEIYTQDSCRFCSLAKELAVNNRYRFMTLDVKVRANRDALKKRMGRLPLETVPQIFIGPDYIGGFTDLEALHKSGVLATMGVKL